MAAGVGWGRGAKNARFLGVGLQVGLQSGVTFFKKWGYTFWVLEGGIEGRELAILKG
jgi:hypothetical protein